jgi:hypothetical protein
MPLRDWAVTDNAAYHKAQPEIDAIITTALLNGPRSSYDLMGLLRAAGYGNAINDNPLELSYSMTGAIYRSAQNSLRNRGIICDSWDVYFATGVRKDPGIIYSVAHLRAVVEATTTPHPQTEAANV